MTASNAAANRQAFARQVQWLAKALLGLAFVGSVVAEAFLYVEGLKSGRSLGEIFAANSLNIGLAVNCLVMLLALPPAILANAGAARRIALFGCVLIQAFLAGMVVMAPYDTGPSKLIGVPLHVLFTLGVAAFVLPFIFEQRKQS